MLLEGVGAAKVSFTFITHLFRLLPIELSLFFCVGTSVISYIILPSSNCNILSLKCGLTKNIIFEHFVGLSGRDVKTVYFSEPVTGLPKLVFYRLPKGLL